MESRACTGLGPFYTRAQAVTAGELAVLNRIGAGLNWVLVADTVRGKKHEDRTAPNCSFQKYFEQWPIKGATRQAGVIQDQWLTVVVHYTALRKTRATVQISKCLLTSK